MTLSSQPSRKKPETFIILEGGGVKGSALVGALQEARQRVEIIGIGGTSAGAIVASLFAAGYTPEEIHTLMATIDYRLLAKRFLIPRRFGTHSSEYIYTWLKDRISIKIRKVPGKQVRFAEMPMPLKIMAADLQNQEIAIFSRQGSADMEVAAAVRMSMSIPLFYEMITYGPRQLVDGGIISNFPLWLFEEERLSSASGVSVIGFDLTEPITPR
jgi:NTE family protein